MQGDAAAGGRGGPSKRPSGAPSNERERRDALPTTDDEIQEKYLERAIRELNQLTRRLQECSHCPRGNLMPVLGSGHPQADVMLLKHAPTAAEIEEGVAFYGRAGNALMKSFKRLGIDPLTVYGTLCVKCPVADPGLAAGECVERIVEEIAIVQPRMIVVMGERALGLLNEVGVPLAREVEPELGKVQSLTPTIDVLYVPDIDESLDSEESKREFWAAFRALGEWYSELPPY
jgi:uracil-DNA glycosylase family 4